MISGASLRFGLRPRKPHRFGLTHMSALWDLAVGALEPQSAAKTDL